MVCLDLVGPFTIRTPAKTHSLLAFMLALTMIDPATGWFEIVKATNNSVKSIQDLFHNTWLARYPQPQFIVFDNGTIGANSNLSSNKYTTTMALNPNQLQVKTINPQENICMDHQYSVVEYLVL
jgi:hypothetical protein